MKLLGTLISLFILVAFEALATQGVKANLRQLAQQHHLTNAQQIQQFHKSNPMFSGNHYQDLVRTLAGSLQAKALNAGKYGVSKKAFSSQGQTNAKQMPGQQRLKSFKEKATDGTAYLGHKLKSLNGHMPAQQHAAAAAPAAPIHHGQINEMSGKKTNKLKINPALKQRLLQSDSPMTMSTKPLSKGMPPRGEFEEDNSSSSPMGFGARTRDRINTFKNLQNQKLNAAAPTGATAASAGGAGRSSRRQNLVPKMNHQEMMRNFGPSAAPPRRTNTPPQVDEYEYDYSEPDQRAPTPSKPSATLKAADKKSPVQVMKTQDTETKMAPKPKEVQTKTPAAVEPQPSKPEETEEDQGKEHIFIPRHIYRPRPSKKTNQTEPQAETTTTTTTTKQPAEVTSTTTTATVAATQVSSTSTSTTTPAPEINSATSEHIEEAKETITELRAKKVESSQETPSSEKIVPLKAFKAESESQDEAALNQEIVSSSAEPATAGVVAPTSAEAEQLFATEQAEQAVQQPQAAEESVQQADPALADKEVRLMPINLQTLNAQLAFEEAPEAVAPIGAFEPLFLNTFQQEQHEAFQEQLMEPNHAHALYHISGGQEAPLQQQFHPLQDQTPFFVQPAQPAQMAPTQQLHFQTPAPHNLAAPAPVGF